jgi:uncharacterized protein (DUF885 family)
MPFGLISWFTTFSWLRKNFQPLKQNYENWLKRIEGFKQWADTAIANFDGIAIGMVLPKTLVVK